MADTFTAVFDACVLYPFPLRDLFVQLATTGQFLGRWTDAIHDEWIRAVLEQNPRIAPDRLLRTRQLMNQSVPDCLVSGYESLIEAISLPDPNDRHVVAAAIVCDADVIVTKNLKDFPIETLRKWGIEPQHPDDFLTCLIDLNPAVVCGSVRACRQRRKSPPASVDQYLQILAGQELNSAVAALRTFSDVL